MHQSNDMCPNPGYTRYVTCHAGNSIDILDPIGEHLILEFAFNSYSKYGREFASGDFYCVVPMKASDEWQTLTVNLDDLQPKLDKQTGRPIDWQTLDHLTISDQLEVTSNGETNVYRSNAKRGQGRQMRYLKWVGGTYPKTILLNGGGLELNAAEYQQQFNDQIDVSIDLEEKVDGLQPAQN